VLAAQYREMEKMRATVFHGVNDIRVAKKFPFRFSAAPTPEWVALFNREWVVAHGQ
jgi:hypothetical protein